MMKLTRVVLAALLVVGMTATVSAQSPVLDYHFNESSSPAIDYEGSNDASWNGGIISGVDGAETFNDDLAYRFDGTDTYLDTSGSPMDFSGSNRFTVNTWFKTTDSGTQGYIFSTGIDKGVYIRMDDGNVGNEGGVVFKVDDGSNGGAVLNDAVTVEVVS